MTKEDGKIIQIIRNLVITMELPNQIKFWPISAVFKTNPHFVFLSHSQRKWSNHAILVNDHSRAIIYLILFRKFGTEKWEAVTANLCDHLTVNWGKNIDSRFNWMIHLCHVFVQKKEPGLVCPVQTSNTQCFSLWRAYIKQFHRGIERSAQSSIEVIDQFHYIWYKMTIVFLHVMTFNFRSHQDGSNQGKKKKATFGFSFIVLQFFSKLFGSDTFV